MPKIKKYYFSRYNGEKSCLICGSYENLAVNLDRKLALELVLCEKCINAYKTALKKD